VTAQRLSSRLRSLAPLLVLVALVATVPVVLSLTGVADAPSHRYEKRSVDGRRALDRRWESDYQYEATFEKCEIQSIHQMAATFHVPATPTAVARAYARHHAPATRTAVYNGCRDAYLGRWNPPKD